MTHKENYDYTMNRMKHIAEQGYKVKYIWITDFRRYTLDLEESERTGKTMPDLFDYMNVNKRYKGKDNKKEDVKLLYKGSQREKRLNTKYLSRNVTCVPDNIKDVLDKAF